MMYQQMEIEDKDNGLDFKLVLGVTNNNKMFKNRNSMHESNKIMMCC